MYTTKLKKREEIAKGTMAFHFEKPEGVEYKAGNSFDWTLINPSEIDAEGNTRSFSSVTAPYEQKLVIATRMRDTAFKRVLKNLPIGSEIKFEGPFGSFTLPNKSEKPVVLLAGGIGITPFISMIKHATHEKLPHKIFLFYSNRTPEDAAFLEELYELAKQNPNFTFIPIMTQPENSSQKWEGEREHVNRAMLEKYIGNLSGPLYFIAGPSQMVSALREALLDAGVDEDDIRREDFPGY